MAQVRTIVFAAGQELVAHNLAPVFALWIALPPSLRVDRTADFSALVLLAIFGLVADPIALERVDLEGLLSTHVLFSLLTRVVNHVAGQFALMFAAGALFDHGHLTLGTVAIVTGLHALVLATGEVALTDRLAGWDWLCALFALTANQFFDQVVA